jgi:hypothetical protein
MLKFQLESHVFMPNKRLRRQSKRSSFLRKLHFEKHMTCCLLPGELIDELDSIDPVVLQQWAVDGRYPGDLPDATAAEANEVLLVAAAIVAAMDSHLAKP